MSMSHMQLCGRVPPLVFAASDSDNSLRSVMSVSHHFVGVCRLSVPHHFRNVPPLVSAASDPNGSLRSVMSVRHHFVGVCCLLLSLLQVLTVLSCFMVNVRHHFLGVCCHGLSLFFAASMFNTLVSLRSDRFQHLPLAV